jgi:voltage-gated potassium channel
LLFTAEYFTRIWTTGNRLAYVTSFWGIVDLLALLPTYIAFLIPEAAPLLIIRLIRVMRIFRVLSLFELFAELTEIIKVLRNTARTILVFFVLVMIVVVVFACLIYVIEGPEHGFTSIPVSVYWAVVTITTVGYGDLTPQTGLGKSLAAFGMLVGYSILAVPTAIITAKLWERLNKRRILYVNWNCPICSAGEHTPDADFCKHCGGKLDMPESVRSAASGLENS